MITCPECGQEAPDDAKFCDRCGQGLSKAASSAAQSSPTRPTPLTAGASLKGGIEIVALTSQTSIENRYRAKRVRDGKTESIALRERLGPDPANDVIEEAPVGETPKAGACACRRSQRAEREDGGAETAVGANQRNRVGCAAIAARVECAGGGIGERATASGRRHPVSGRGVRLSLLADAAENASPDEASEAAEAAVVAETQHNAASERWRA